MAQKRRNDEIDYDADECCETTTEPVEEGIKVPVISKFRTDVRFKKQKLFGPHPDKPEETSLYCLCKTKKGDESKPCATILLNKRYVCAGRVGENGTINKCGMQIQERALTLMNEHPILKSNRIALPIHLCNGVYIGVSQGSKWSAKNRFYMTCICSDVKNRITFGYDAPELAPYFNQDTCKSIQDDSMVEKSGLSSAGRNVVLVAPDFDDEDDQ